MIQIYFGLKLCIYFQTIRRFYDKIYFLNRKIIPIHGTRRMKKTIIIFSHATQKQTLEDIISWLDDEMFTGSSKEQSIFIIYSSRFFFFLRKYFIDLIIIIIHIERGHKLLAKAFPL